MHAFFSSPCPFCPLAPLTLPQQGKSREKKSRVVSLGEELLASLSPGEPVSTEGTLPCKIHAKSAKVPRHRTLASQLPQDSRLGPL